MEQTKKYKLLCNYLKNKVIYTGLRLIIINDVMFSLENEIYYTYRRYCNYSHFCNSATIVFFIIKCAEFSTNYEHKFSGGVKKGRKRSTPFQAVKDNYFKCFEVRGRIIIFPYVRARTHTHTHARTTNSTSTVFQSKARKTCLPL